MKDEEYKLELKKEIENKREKLNKIIIDEPNKGEVLKFSQELDILISEYTKYVLDVWMKNSRWWIICCFLFWLNLSSGKLYKKPHSNKENNYKD